MKEIETPFDRHRDVVRPEWIDRNGHLNVGFYVLAFDFASDRATAITNLAPRARQTETGIGLTNAPSISHRSLRLTGRAGSN